MCTERRDSKLHRNMSEENKSFCLPTAKSADKSGRKKDKYEPMKGVSQFTIYLNSNPTTMCEVQAFKQFEAERNYNESFSTNSENSVSLDKSQLS